MSSQLYNLDFSGLDGKQQNTTVMSYEERFPVSMRKLRTSAVTIPKIDELIQKRIDKGLSKHFIQYEVTTTTDAKMFLQRFEEWMVIMLVAKVHRSKREEEARNLHVRLLKDPVGALAPDLEDELCYIRRTSIQVVEPDNDAAGADPSTSRATTPAVTRSRGDAPTTGDASTDAASTTGSPTTTQVMTNTTQYLQTDFLQKLRRSQEDIYLRLRVNLAERMDNTAQSELKRYLEQEQRELINSNTSLTDTNFFDVKNRIKWDSIKNFVMDTLCRVPLEGDRFIKLRTMMRADNSTVTFWVQSVHDTKIDIDSMRGLWMNQSGKEAMHTATRWMTKAEEGLVLTQVHKENMQRQYPTFTKLAITMKMTDLLKLCAKLDPKAVPTNFKRMRHLKALRPPSSHTMRLSRW